MRWTVVGEAADGQAAIEGVLAQIPTSRLMDVSMPVIDGFAGRKKDSRQRVANQNPDAVDPRLQERC